jgi:hypothetical protein
VHPHPGSGPVDFLPHGLPDSAAAAAAAAAAYRFPDFPFPGGLAAFRKFLIAFLRTFVA